MVKFFLQLCFAVGVHLATDYIETMNVAGSFILGLSLTVLTFSIAQADTLAMASNPYSAIPERNVFALVPIPVPPTVDPETLKDPPPKITHNGTMNLFGQMQVLFKVAVKPLPGQPAKDQSYVMAEGERQDDITVVKIDSKTGIITFNNHGKIQELPLVEAPKGSVGSVPAPAATTTASAGTIPAPGAGINAMAAARLARAAKGEGATPATKSADAPSLGNAATASTQSQAENSAVGHKSSLGADVTPEEEIALKYLEAKAKNDPAAAIFPLTDAKKKEVEGLLEAPAK